MTTSTDRRQGVNSSIAVKVPVVAATTANITLSGTQTIDGVAVVADDRVLVKDQTDGTENGIYDVSSSTWSRSPDFDGSYDVVTGTFVKVNIGGTANGGYWYEVTTTGDITIGSTSLTFQNFSPEAVGISSAADATAISIDSSENVTFNQNITVTGTAEFNDAITLDTGANTDTILDEDGLDRTSASRETFTLENSGAGELVLDVPIINETKGSDIASAATTDIGAATGNFVDITGTTTITALGTVKAGTRRTVQFDGALILTHNATSLILPLNANITTAAGDVAEFISLGSGNWLCTRYQRDAGIVQADLNSASLNPIAQVQYTNYATYSNTATAMPHDNSIPQNTEGAEFFTVAITPTSASNLLIIEAIAYVGAGTGNDNITMALFQDSTAGALAAAHWKAPSTGTQTGMIPLRYIMAAGTTSATTFKIRIGAAAGTAYVNGDSGSRLYGGVSVSSIQVTEVTQ